MTQGHAGAGTAHSPFLIARLHKLYQVINFPLVNRIFLENKTYTKLSRRTHLNEIKRHDGETTVMI